VVRVPGVTGRADRCREGNYPEKQVEEKERKEKKRKERKRADGERKSTACQCRPFNWDRVVQALKASRQGAAKPSFNQRAGQYLGILRPSRLMMRVLVLMRTDVVSDSAVFVFNSPRIAPVPTTQRS
jgi:uncharacterized Rmd1/YagE family protein